MFVTVAELKVFLSVSLLATKLCQGTMTVGDDTSWSPETDKTSQTKNFVKEKGKYC